MIKERIVKLNANIFYKLEDGNNYPCIRLEDDTGNAIIAYCTYVSLEGLLDIFSADYEYRLPNEKIIYNVYWGNNTDCIVRSRKTGIIKTDWNKVNK